MVPIDVYRHAATRARLSAIRRKLIERYGE